jgi:hypothetical protein
VSSLGLAAALVLLAGPDTVLLLRSDDASRAALEERVSAELAASGFQVSSGVGALETTADIPGQLWARCKLQNTRAVLWLASRGDGQIDAWVAEPDTAKAMVRTWMAPATYSERATLALKAVELLHAMLLETGAIEPDDPDLPSAHVRFKKRFQPAWTFGTGLGVIVTPGNLRPQPLLELQLGYAFRKDFALDVQLASSVWPVHSIVALGEADIGVAFLRVMGQWTPVRAGPAAFSLAGGTGLFLLWVSGQTSPVAADPPSAIVSPGWMISGGPNVAFELIDRVRLQLIVNVSAVFPQLVAEVAQVPIATVQLLFDALLRLEFE